ELPRRRFECVRPDRRPRKPRQRWIGEEAGIGDEDLVAVAEEGLEDRVKSLLGAGGDANLGVGIDAKCFADALAQRERSRIRRVAPRRRRGAPRHLAQRLVRLEVRLADAEVDGERRGEGVDLADEGELDAVEARRDLHRSASSSAVALSVRSSRYFTMTGVCIDSACCSANAPFSGRAPGTTTAPYGISSGCSAVRR